MGFALKRLGLAFLLICTAAAILLAADRRPHKAGTGKERAALPKAALLVFASRPILDETMGGILSGMAEGGFIEGKTIEYRRFNAENDLPTLANMGKTIAGGDYQLVITVSTPALQAMAGANTEGRVRHIFAAVTDPFGAGVGIKRGEPLNHPSHLAGIGTFQPVKEVFRLAKRFNPALKTVGEVWNPAEACSEACTLLAREVAQELGITLLEAHADNSASVGEAAESLVARGVEAIWVGGDNTVEMAMSAVLRAADHAKIPVFANAPSHAPAGVLFGLGANYAEVGKIAGALAADVLHGLDPASVPIENRVPQKLAVRRDLLPGLRDHWEIPEGVEEEGG